MAKMRAFRTTELREKWNGRGGKRLQQTITSKGLISSKIKNV